MLPHRTVEGDLQEGGEENITGEPGSDAEELSSVQFSRSVVSDSL